MLCQGNKTAPPLSRRIPKYPRRTQESLKREAALIAALEAGVLRQRLYTNMHKPKPFRFEADLLSRHNGTAQAMELNWWSTVQRASIELGRPMLLMDEAAISDWKNVVHEMEVPTKHAVRWQRGNGLPLEPSASRRAEPGNGGFGVPGTLIWDAERRRWRAWLDQETPRHFESAEGVLFYEHGNLTLRDPEKFLATSRFDAGLSANGRGRAFIGPSDSRLDSSFRPLLAQTFTVLHDVSAPPAERFKAGFHCGAFGHAPEPSFWHLYAQQQDEQQRQAASAAAAGGGSSFRLNRSTYLEAPLFRGMRVAIWESTCVGYSSDGLDWRLYDLVWARTLSHIGHRPTRTRALTHMRFALLALPSQGHAEGIGPVPLRDAADTANVLFAPLRSKGVLRLANRWSAAVAPGTFGTDASNPNWWREVRGVRISANRGLSGRHGDGDAAAAAGAGGGGGGSGGADLGPFGTSRRRDKRSARAGTATGTGGSSSAAAARNWVEEVRFALDSHPSGLEHMVRQIYALQVTPWDETGGGSFHVASLTVLHGGKLMNVDGENAPFEHDVLRTYLATSRDGVHFDLGWVYAESELIPSGKCHSRAQACATVAELNAAVAGAPSHGFGLEELCCEFDVGIVYPTSHIVTKSAGDGTGRVAGGGSFGGGGSKEAGRSSASGEHLLMYEGRLATHETRYSRSKSPVQMATARWAMHRISGVRRDPQSGFRSDSVDRSLSGLQTCGTLTTKALPPPPATSSSTQDWHIRVNVRAAAGSATALHAELLRGCSASSATPIAGFARSDHSGVREDAFDAVLRWTGGRAAPAPSTESSTPLWLRFFLCGDAKLFSFIILHEPPPAAGVASRHSSPAPPPSPPPPHPRHSTSLLRGSAGVGVGARGVCGPTRQPIDGSNPVWYREGKARPADPADQPRRMTFNTLRLRMTSLDDCLALCSEERGLEQQPKCNYISASLSAPCAPPPSPSAVARDYPL